MKKLLLSIGAVASVTLPIASVVACGTSKDKASNQVAWSDQIVTSPQKVHYTWKADECNTMADVIKQMNDQLQFQFSKNVGAMTPYDLGNYLINFYNRNGGGLIDFSVQFDGKEDTVSINTNEVLKELVGSFDGPPSINKDSKRFYGTDVEALAQAVGGMGFGAMMSMFGKYGEAIFNTNANIIQLTTSIADGSSTTEYPMIGKMLGLLAPLPKTTMQKFPKFIELFTQLGNQFTSSPVASAWAAAKGLTKEFSEVDKLIITSAVNSGK